MDLTDHPGTASMIPFQMSAVGAPIQTLNDPPPLLNGITKTLFHPRTPTPPTNVQKIEEGNV